MQIASVHPAGVRRAAAVLVLSALVGESPQGAPRHR